MKTYTKWYITAGLVLALVTTLALAQGIGMRYRRNQAFAGFSPLRAMAFLQDLDLTDSQKSQIKGILSLHKTEIVAAANAIVDTRLALNDALQANSNQLESFFLKAFEAEKKALLLRHSIAGEITKILTPTQKAMIDEKRLEIEDQLQEWLSRLEKFLNGLS